MDQNAVMLFVGMGVLAAAGFFLPYLLGDSYYFRKWRLVSVFFVVIMIWVLLTPNGCHFG